MKKTNKILKIVLPMILATVILLISKSTSLGYTNEEKEEYKSKAEDIIAFYSNMENWIVDDEGNLTGYKGKTNEDIEKDINILKVTDSFTTATRGGTNDFKYKIQKRLEILQTFLDTQEQQKNDEKEKEENNNDENKQEELKKYSIDQMVEYYENHNNSLASLPETGNVRETWILKLKNTSEYKKYISSTTQRDNALASYKTGEKYYKMISSIDPSSNDEIARNHPVKNDNNYTPSTGGLVNPTTNGFNSLDEIINAGKDFISKGENKLSLLDMKDVSNNIYNLLLIIGIFLAVAVGMFLGIKFMASSAEDKAKVKEALVPYIVGCVVIFGAFVIWKLAITLLGGIA